MDNLMNNAKSIAVVVLIIFGLIGLFILWKWLKPYIIRYDTTLLFTGGLGSGKSLSSVKTAITLVKKNRFYKYRLPNFLHYYCGYYIRVVLWWLFNFWKRKNKRKALPIRCKKREKPLLYSNIPICFRSGGHFWNKKYEWSVVLNERHLLLLERMVEYSVTLIDECPQLVNQFNWSEELVQKNLNEFITYYRHYIGGYLVLNGQSTSDIVVQIRRKLNVAIWCFGFHSYLGLIYSINMLDIMMNDDVQTMSSTMIDENTRRHWGILLGMRKVYDSRCYRLRYDNCLLPVDEMANRFTRLTTNKIIRLTNYCSPLDDETSDEKKAKMLERSEQLQRGEALERKHR